MRPLITIDSDVKNVLRTKAQPITMFGKRLNPLIDNMFAVMEEHGGAGFAAPQIGVSQRIIIVGRRVLINPLIVQNNGKIQLDDEGCLSIPNVKQKIERLDAVAVAYLNMHRTQCIQWFHDIESSIVQHEIDHLDGKLIIDYGDEIA